MIFKKITYIFGAFVLMTLLLHSNSRCSASSRPEIDRKVSVEMIAQAPVDETFFGMGNPKNYWNPDINHLKDKKLKGGRPKRNGGYLWAMAGCGDNLWFGTNNNGWCGWMMVTGLFSCTETSRWVCETNLSNFPKQLDENGEPFFPKDGAIIQADWRPPEIYYYNVKTKNLTKMMSDNPKFKKYVNRSFGFRGGGSIGNIVFMAANPIVQKDQAVYLLAFNGITGRFIDGVKIDKYINVRKFAVFEDSAGNKALYVLMGSDIHDPAHPNHLLRWIGTEEHPFGTETNSETPGFEVVGDFGNAGIGAELIMHKGKVIVTTWGSRTIAAGLYASNLMPAGGFTKDNKAVFKKVFDASDFDPDPVIANGWLIGALAEFDGYVYWGSMHPTGQTYHALCFVHPKLRGSEEAILKSHRKTTVFRTSFADPEKPVTELLYGDKELWAFNGTRWEIKANKAGLQPLYGPSGFGELLNDYTFTLIKWNNKLYLGTFDVSGGVKTLMDENVDVKGSEVLRTVGKQINEGDFYPGFDLYRFDSADSPAKAETLTGFDNPCSNGVRNAIVMNGDLYIGTTTDSNLDYKRGGWHIYRLTAE